MTARRDFPPRPPAALNEKLPQPVPPAQRDPEPVRPQAGSVAAEPKPETLADQCLLAAEKGAVAWLHPAGNWPELIGQFTRTGVYQRDGFGTAAVVIDVGVQLRRLIAEVTRPGRLHDRPHLDIEVGHDADISDPTVLQWLGRLIDEARQLRIPVLMLLAQEIIPSVVTDDVQAALRGMAIPGVCIALIRDLPGSGSIRLTEDVAPEPEAKSPPRAYVPRAPANLSPETRKRMAEWRAKAAT